MIFSKACEYGIRATLYIAQQSLKEQRVSLKAIAKEIDGPEAFTAKTLQQLAKNNIVISTKGPSGGFQMNRKAMDEIHLMQIVEAIDGKDVFTKCGLGLAECSEKYPCPVHEKFKVVRNGLRHMLDTTSIYELAIGLEEKQTYLKNKIN